MKVGLTDSISMKAYLFRVTRVAWLVGAVFGGRNGSGFYSTRNASQD